MTVLIPAYEPDKKMIQLIWELKAKTSYNILIVDDGSGIEYNIFFKASEEIGATVIHHEKNLGKGAALKTGFRYLMENMKDESVVCADSDGQHSVRDICRIADEISPKNKEIILGVREFDGKIPFKSRFGNSISAFMFRVATGIPISDTQTGLRAYPYTLLEWLCGIKGNRFDYELRQLLQAPTANIKIKQLTIKTIYENNNSGTHFHPLKDSVAVLLPMLGFCLSSLSAYILDFILLFLFRAVFKSLFLSVLCARVISSTYNYLINNHFIFKTGNISKVKSAPKYFILAAVIMLMNYCLLSLMIDIIGAPQVLSKLLTELVLFGFSYAAQRLFVFRNPNRRHAQ